MVKQNKEPNDSDKNVTGKTTADLFEMQRNKFSNFVKNRLDELEKIFKNKSK